MTQHKESALVAKNTHVLTFFNALLRNRVHIV